MTGGHNGHKFGCNTSVETKLLQSHTGWMCGVVVVSFKRFLSVKALSPRSGEYLLPDYYACTFSCTLNFEHCQRRHTCVVLPGQGDSDGVTKARPCCRRMDSGEKWSGVRHLSINNRARPALQPSSVLWPAGRADNGPPADQHDTTQNMHTSSFQLL